MSIIEAVHHVRWSIENSPKAYAECRDMLMDLRVQLVNAELRYKREREENDTAR